MQRELRFRAWDKVNKVMIPFDFNGVYGYEGEVNGVILPDCQTVLNYNSGYGKDGMNEDLIIMQSTGLRDKNGIEIYEGDKDAHGNVVEYLNGCYCLNGDRPLSWMISTFEVAGNIYESSTMPDEGGQ